MKRIGIFVFDDVEVLDACGPFEVFAATRDADGRALFEVVTVAQDSRPIQAVGGLLIQPQHILASCPPLDVLVVPGGVGRKLQSKNPVILEWMRHRVPQAEVVLSVCTGAFILAAAGVLTDGPVTTHHSAHDELEGVFPGLSVDRSARFVDRGHIVTAAGISAGIDASLHVLERLAGNAVAVATAARMEYPFPR